MFVARITVRFLGGLRELFGEDRCEVDLIHAAYHPESLKQILEQTLSLPPGHLRDVRLAVARGEAGPDGLIPLYEGAVIALIPPETPVRRLSRTATGEAQPEGPGPALRCLPRQ